VLSVMTIIIIVRLVLDQDVKTKLTTPLLLLLVLLVAYYYYCCCCCCCCCS